VAGESVNFPGTRAFLESQGVEVVDLADPECIEIMRDFIARHPELWFGDIGR
jgi:cytosine deaminase